MKTKIVPFDLETARKIQAGEIEGKIKTRDGYDVNILTFDRLGSGRPIVALMRYREKLELVVEYTVKGSDEASSSGDLVLEIPDNEPQFKPFDKVLVRDGDDDFWRAGFFSNYLNDVHYPYYTDGGCYVQRIPFEGDQELVGTTNKPKED